MKNVNPHELRKFCKIKFILFLHILLAQAVLAQVSPEEQFSKLFEAVQMVPVFKDSKVFPDCTPRYSTDVILQEYSALLDSFVAANFVSPRIHASGYESNLDLSVEEHINELWGVLTRQPDSSRGSLIPLPHPYVVPGGRFREVYYWDSYFTMLGLQVAGKDDLIHNMVDNFSYLIDKLGFIPNGNRTYYASRSQPPFYSLMLCILAEVKGDEILEDYLPQLEKEYDFWMDGAVELNEEKPTHRRVVLLPDGSILNRYWDDKATPRPESFKEDVHIAETSGRPPAEIYVDIRAGAESGWDFSSRWLRDGESLSTIHTTEIVPVDLNALLYHLETTIAHVLGLRDEARGQQYYSELASKRAQAIHKYCWSEQEGFYMDYDFAAGTTTNIYSLAAIYPLFFEIASENDAEKIASRIKEDFLQPGGLVTTLSNTKEQWDEPNGWAPLQWIGVKGLRNYGFEELAGRIRDNWIDLNKRVYENTGKMMEKYNVMDVSLEAGGGEYDLQDGFGWTNGVYLKLKSED